MHLRRISQPALVAIFLLALCPATTGSETMIGDSGIVIPEIDGFSPIEFTGSIQTLNAASFVPRCDPSRCQSFVDSDFLGSIKSNMTPAFPIIVLLVLIDESDSLGAVDFSKFADAVENGQLSLTENIESSIYTSYIQSTSRTTNSNDLVVFLPELEKIDYFSTSDSHLSLSYNLKFAFKPGAEPKIEKVVPITIGVIFVRNKFLLTTVYGQDGLLAWTQGFTQSLANDIIAANASK